MLSRKYRLPLRTELRRVKATGKLAHGRLFSLLVAKQFHPEDGRPLVKTISNHPSRFAFIISSRVHKKAAKRNRTKRLLGEAIYSLTDKIKPGFEVVFLAKKAIIGKELGEIKSEVEKIFHQANLTI